MLGTSGNLPPRGTDTTGRLFRSIRPSSLCPQRVVDRVTYKSNRWVNTIVAAVNIFAVVTGGHGLYYVFFAAVEVLSMLLIVWLAWKRLEAEPVS